MQIALVDNKIKITLMVIQECVFLFLRSAHDHVHLTQNGFCRYIVASKFILLSTSYSDCVVYNKTIIPLSVGESGGYLPPLQ